MHIAATGLLANLIFWPALFIFAALRPDYSHLTKAISELGTWGAPRMWWWNVIGYMIPGALLGTFGWQFGRMVAPRRVVLPVLLALPGLGLLISGVFPGDLEHRTSMTTRLHLAGTFLGMAMLPALLMLVLRIRTTWRDFAILSIVPLVGLLGVFSLYSLAPAVVVPHPGLVQRLMFVDWMGWYLGAALLLLRRAATGVAPTRRY